MDHDLYSAIEDAEEIFHIEQALVSRLKRQYPDKANQIKSGVENDAL